MPSEAVRARARLEKRLHAAQRRGDEDLAHCLRGQIAKVVDRPACASCGELAEYLIDDALSDSFTTMRNASRAWAFGGGAVCTACVWCARSVALRSCLWFARLPDAHGVGGVWFVPIRPLPGAPMTRQDPLEALLHPPPAPFVAGLPLYGIDHGGENNAHRAIWPWVGPSNRHPSVRDGLWVPPDPLVKLQSKHTALYADVSLTATRYRLQVDDALEVTVDVALWGSLRHQAMALLTALRAGGVGAIEAREALRTLRAPSRAPLALIAPSSWRSAVSPFVAHAGAPWWALFVNLLPMPDLKKDTL